MRTITATHIVAAIVGIVGVMGLYTRMNAPEPSHQASEVKRDNVKELLDSWDKGRAR